jgi:hypothetical protein
MLGFLFREVALCAEKTTAQGFIAHSREGCFKILSILRALRPDFDILPASECFTDRYVGWVQHGRAPNHREL